MIELTPGEVRAFRLERQHLRERAPRERLVDVVADVGGVQAQVASAAELQLWARVDGITAEEVRAALWERRELVKTWCMRGTLHLLPAREFALWAGALANRTAWRRDAWLRYFEVTEEEMEALLATIAETLDGEGRTREELAAVAAERVAPHVGEKLLHGWGTALKPAAFAGLLCFGPSRGRNVTFVSPSAWLGDATPADPEASLAEVARRFLRAYGPATHEDLARWWGGASSPARRLLASIEDELVDVEAEGRRARLLADDAERIATIEPVRSTRLVPHFDPYVLHYRPRAAFVAEERAAEIYRTAGWVTPVVLVDGGVGGTWELVRRGRRAEARIAPWARLARDRVRELEREAERLAAFLGLPVDLVL